MAENRPGGVTGRRPKRRDDGDGSVYQLKDGRWQAAVTVGWRRDERTGRTRRVTKTADAPTKPEAREKLRGLLAKRDAGQLPVGEAVTVEHWLTYWLEHIAPRRTVVKTLESYGTLIRHWIVPTIGHVRLTDLEPEHVEQLHDAMYKGKPWTRSNGRTVPAKPLTGSSVLQAHRVLSRALKVAEQRGKITRNPATLVDAPSVSRAVTRDKYLSAEHARAVLVTCAGSWDEARWAVGLALGLRPGERLGLLWDVDVDLAAGTVTVQRQLQRRRASNGQKGTLELVPYPKGKRPRTIAIPPELLTVLRAHRRRQVERRLALGDEWQQASFGDLVFTDPRGRALDPRRDWETWRDLLAEAEVPYVPPHGSRHTAASLMLLQGVDVRVVQEILGHTSSTITRDLYQHVAPQLARQAAAVVGAALWGEPASVAASVTDPDGSAHQRTAGRAKTGVSPLGARQRTG